MYRNVTKAELLSRSPHTFNQRESVQKHAQTASARNATFLSHSSKDRELVVGAITILTEHGATVYIDEIDPAMPKETTEKTAELLKERIQQSKRFVLLTSENSKDSRWVPWELGIADGYKGMPGIALFPASSQQGADTWTSWEYLGIYRRIVFGDLSGYAQPVWMVVDVKKNIATELRSWLAGS